MKRGTIIDPEERERRLKAIEHERDRGKRQHLAHDFATQILRADAKRRAPKPQPKRIELPATPRPGPWSPLSDLRNLMKKNGGLR
jgi:hypothetical protein